MDDELRPKQLQGTLHERPRLERQAQCGFPAQVKRRPRRGFLIRHPVVGLQQQYCREEAGGNTRTTIVQNVQRGKLIVAEQLATLASQETVKRSAPDEIQIEVVGLKQAALIRTFPKHDEPPIEGSLVLYQ